METVLMVAEKPKAALAVAKVLSNNKCKRIRGANKPSKVYEWNGTFLSSKRTVRYRMTSVFGHIMTLNFTPNFRNRKAVDPISLFDASIVKEETRKKQKIVEFLSELAVGCKYVVLWMDCDDEGENICFEIKSAVSSSIQNIDMVLYRARFSSLLESEIKYSLANLVKPDENLSKYVDTRRELDLRIGCAFTRQLTEYLRGYKELKSAIISYGPCQTLALALCVQRADEVTNFKPEEYWEFTLTATLDDCTVVFYHNNEKKIKKKDIAESVLQKLKKFKEAQLLKIKSELIEVKRPLPLNTYEFLKACSFELNISPFDAMKTAESLYLRGYTSYPRTSSNAFPNKYDYKSTLHKLKDKLKSPFDMQGPVNEDEIGDNFPIIPVEMPTRNLSKGDMDVLMLISRYFLASISNNLIYRTTTAQLKMGDDVFSAKFQEVTQAGFTDIMDCEDLNFLKQENTDIVKITNILKKTDKINTYKLQKHVKLTVKPTYITERELISQLQLYYIGTPGSVPDIINNLYKRNYVRAVRERILIPTMLGKNLIHWLKKVDEELISPTLRVEMKNQLKSIARGEAKVEEVKEVAIRKFYEKFVYMKTKNEDLHKLMTVHFKIKSIIKCKECTGTINLQHATEESQHIWNLKCVQCTFNKKCFQGAVSVIVIDKECDTCESGMIKATYFIKESEKIVTDVLCISCSSLL
ncbi:DNA topoisomerase 3-beta-like [Teleopsis dalmanni]|uniref:DNA topoisomerase 3-beta-like n=1 Tax=Teleopsis dalmanni TaxID=139649 RepID=UPI0018CE138E|nr:DNA topoisomerase 3-beta-like [Teleopsis dalmanni]XP_037957214.1 DNA topoisomerase 3-beta-like [Teleopsis dalmanni]